ncbi:hypothetical protein [Georgenia alba]|uniref:Protein kinase domain-containing protein n=1 Tax=Georgenia alba TaxID=2233858 RepID=A0ABW2Q780_9MICO
MDLITALAPGSRIIDVGADSPRLARALADAGQEHYLGLVPARLLETVRAAAGPRSGRFVELASPTQVARSSTDVVILRAGFVPQLWTFGDLSHARLIAVERRRGPAALERRLAELLPRLTGRTVPRGRFTCAGSEFDVVEVTRTRVRRARRYLSPYWGVEGLVERLREHHVRYAVLRWFEELPVIAPGEDLDLLVADADIDVVERLLDTEPGTIPVDLYSETGLTGTDYRGMAYYPPPLARQILERAVAHRSGCRVPAPADHLRSMAYHAVYHKGVPSGLPARATGERAADPEHDYAAVLGELAAAQGVDLEPTLEGVDEYLAVEGWRPPPDTLRRLAATNPWVRPAEQGPAEVPEPAVFLIREHTFDVLGTEEILRVLRTLGFEILLVRELDLDARARCAAHMRGGNWGRGPFPVSGGGPGTVVVAAHYGPRPPGPRVRAQYPWLSNMDVLIAKSRIRDLLAARLPADRRFNAMHSADNEAEAWEYVALAVPDRDDALRAEIVRRRRGYTTDLPVLEVLQLGRRAKVEVVRTSDGPAVRKTFAPAAHRHLERELRGLRELAPRVPVLELLDEGPSWVQTPLYDNTLRELGDRPGGRLVPLRTARRMAEVLRDVHALGFDLVDAKPQNFLLDPRRGLRLLDLEFLHRYEGPAPAFHRMYGFVGVPADFAGDVPFVDDLSYELRWRPYVGLSLEQLLDAPPWEQHLRRGLFRAHRVLTGTSEPVRRLGRTARTAVRLARSNAGTTYRYLARRRSRAGFALRA